MFNQFQAVLLAAGKSTRCNTKKSKLLEPICGQEMILYPINLLNTLGIPTTIIVGYQKDQLTSVIQPASTQDITFVTQETQHGAAHAISCALDTLSYDHILIMNGDMPLVTPDIITELYQEHIRSKSIVSFVTSHNLLQTGSYSRILKTGKTIKIIPPEEKPDSTHEYCCINAGIYIVERNFLIDNIKNLDHAQADTDFCFTDIIKIASAKELPMATISAPFDTIRGINNFEELWAAEQVKRSELIKYWMHNGVRFRVAQNIHIDIHVEIGAGTIIGAGVQLFNGTKIGKDCDIREFSTLEDVVIHDGVTIQPHCVLKKCTIDSHASIGPFAHIYNNSHIMQHGIVGNFAEINEHIIDTHINDKTIGAPAITAAQQIRKNEECTKKKKQKHSQDHPKKSLSLDTKATRFECAKKTDADTTVID